MIYYRIEWGEWGEDDAWNKIYVSCNTYNLNFPEEKSVDELEQIVHQQILDDNGKPIGIKEGYMCRECQYVDEDDFFNKFLED